MTDIELNALFFSPFLIGFIPVAYELLKIQFIVVVWIYF